MQDMRAIIRDVRFKGDRLKHYAGFLSTAEFLILCLGVGSPNSMKALAASQYPLIRVAWQRIGTEGQAVVLAAWAEG